MRGDVHTGNPYHGEISVPVVTNIKTKTRFSELNFSACKIAKEYQIGNLRSNDAKGKKIQTES